MIDAIRKVQEFHETFQCYLQTAPNGNIPEKEMTVRLRLMQEELDEYELAAENSDIVGIADALTDLLYVVYGTIIAHGLQNVAEELFDEVHRSNMSKLDENGCPVFREDGKVLKSKLFSEPDLEKILKQRQDNLSRKP